jgi:hypothetical protein
MFNYDDDHYEDSVCECGNAVYCPCFCEWYEEYVSDEYCAIRETVYQTFDRPPPPRDVLRL